MACSHSTVGQICNPGLNSPEKLYGLFPGNPKRATTRPSTERILQAFKSVSLTIMKVTDQEYGHVTPLNVLQQKILELLELPPDIYSSLETSPE